MEHMQAQQSSMHAVCTSGGLDERLMLFRNALRFFVSLCLWDALAQLGEHALLASRSARPDDEVDAGSSATCMVRGE
jgi:hypothetical protein